MLYVQLEAYPAGLVPILKPPNDKHVNEYQASM